MCNKIDGTHKLYAVLIYTEWHKLARWSISEVKSPAESNVSCFVARFSKVVCSTTKVGNNFGTLGHIFVPFRDSTFSSNILDRKRNGSSCHALDYQKILRCITNSHYWSLNSHPDLNHWYLLYGTKPTKQTANVNDFFKASDFFDLISWNFHS